MEERIRRILITGGAGFIGSNLSRSLLEKGHEVICIDDLSTGKPENIEELMDNERFTFIGHDVTEPFDVQCDEIYHLACPASPKAYGRDPVATLRTCFLGALNALDLAKKTGARVLLSSTSEVYGEPLVHPQTEDYRGNVSCTGPRACYDEGKRVSETLFFDHGRKYGTDICVVRIFNTYGPFMDPEDGRVIPNFITQALSGEPLTFHGSGEQTRSFCYISDLVGALEAAMAKKGFTGPVNLGNPAEMTVRELASLITELTGSSSVTASRSLPKDDPSRRKPDITLAGKELGWSPAVDIREGLGYTIEYFKGYLRDDGQ